ncbi:Cof-type HAD-IIB family hydrolase [Sporosarcina sp. G11-34]|uniref:Cof-type HAD-IIB family hydrolase n=1 Tax=Sporosarcina sp. G11-34 TaxID=2849605 RepID=UPI0022A9A069|nr:Cof-type HAD-IIB family hydrolase [Sporosarcina sp. G11-34]MCZ2259000.1 Cof-type HAD-IIB family hydrolase [Sporosarcina sp. G11-34]
MKPHLIVLDLDGTLLTDEKKIMPQTAQTLLKAKEQGHHVMLATGRAYRATETYYRELNLTTPVINFNGAFVHHPDNRSWKTIHETLSLPVVLEVMEAMQQFPWNNIIAEVLDDVYVHYHDEKVLDNFKMGQPKVTTGEIQRFLQDDPTSLLIQADESNVESITAHLSSIHAEVVGHRVWNSPWGHVVEVFRKGLSKAAGLAHVAKWMDIPKDRIIAFGDENNDFEMIEYAGFGVAMGNGIDELKSMADEVTLSNNEDGIAKVLSERLNL